MAKQTLEARLGDLERRTPRETRVFVAWNDDDLARIRQTAAPDDVVFVVRWDDAALLGEDEEADGGAWGAHS